MKYTYAYWTNGKRIESQSLYELHEATTDEIRTIKEYLNLCGIPETIAFPASHIIPDFFWPIILDNPHYFRYYPIQREVIKELKKAKLIKLSYKYKKREK